MTRRVNRYVGAGLFTIAAFAAGVAPAALERYGAAQDSKVQVPVFQVDPSWPKPLPNHWILGSVIGAAADPRDHIWIIHRPKTLQKNETRAAWQAAPAVL